MTGFNLPPGCRVSDLPGHSPHDLAYTAGAEAFDGGRDDDANPHRPESPLWGAWLDGYQTAAAEGPERDR